MLAKNNRLNLKHKENQTMFVRGNSDFFASKNILFYYRPNQDQGLKMAAVAAKRLFPKAVDRTQHKRLLYQAFEELVSVNKLNFSDLNFDLIASYRSKKVTISDLKTDFLSAFKHYEII